MKFDDNRHFVVDLNIAVHQSSHFHSVSPLLISAGVVLSCIVLKAKLHSTICQRKPSIKGICLCRRTEPLHKSTGRVSRIYRFPLDFVKSPCYDHQLRPTYMVENKSDIVLLSEKKCLKTFVRTGADGEQIQRICGRQYQK